MSDEPKRTAPPREREPHEVRRFYDFLDNAMKSVRDEPLNQSSLGRKLERYGIDRQLIGRLMRGETHALIPEVANRLVQELPITMDELLEAFGFALGVEAHDRIAPDLIRDINAIKRDPESMRTLRKVLRGLRLDLSGEEDDEPPPPPRNGQPGPGPE